MSFSPLEIPQDGLNWTGFGKGRTVALFDCQVLSSVVFAFILFTSLKSTDKSFSVVFSGSLRTKNNILFSCISCSRRVQLADWWKHGDKSLCCCGILSGVSGCSTRGSLGASIFGSVAVGRNVWTSIVMLCGVVTSRLILSFLALLFAPLHVKRSKSQTIW